MIQVIKTKEMKSSTKVEGLLVQMSNNQWYALTRLMPPRHGWYLRCGPSSSTGKMDLVKDVLYMIPYASVKPEFQDGIDLLTNILNGNEEAVITMPNYS